MNDLTRNLLVGGALIGGIWLISEHQQGVKRSGHRMVQDCVSSQYTSGDYAELQAYRYCASYKGWKDGQAAASSTVSDD